MKPKKILILGISGTGKTTLARKLSKLLDIPVYHLDKYIWKKNWIEASQQEAEEKIRDIINKPSWIIEGWISPLAELKLQTANTILYLNYSGIRVLLGGIKRWWKNKGKVREEMPAGCIEKFDLKYLKVMFKRLERPEIEDTVKKFEDKIIRIKSPHDVKNIMSKFYYDKNLEH